MAELYDKFAHALDPFSQEADHAEGVFNSELSVWYDSLQDPKPSFREFRKAIITQCKRHLRASDKPQDQKLLGSLDKKRIENP